LTLDYIGDGRARQYIECNPRTVEPANAAAAGVNLSELQVRLTHAEDLPPPPRVGRAGVRTHGTMALLLGAAARRPGRRAVLVEIGRARARRDCYRGSREQLTPIVRDPPSLGALMFIVARLLASPGCATDLAGHAVSRYSITPEASPPPPARDRERPLIPMRAANHAEPAVSFADASNRGLA
jgi:hypothetical protein